MGTLMTLDLPSDSPVADLPWVITIGPMDDDEGWEPVVCGPYERGHALALGQAVVADEELMAVVEPLLPLVDADAIRDEIELAKVAADPDAEPSGDDAERAAQDWETRHVKVGRAPTAAEVKAGFARIAGRLPGLAAGD